MAMTATVKDELSRLAISKPCCRKAEVSALLRFAGGLHVMAGLLRLKYDCFANCFVANADCLYLLRTLLPTWIAQRFP